MDDQNNPGGVPTDPNQGGMGGDQPAQGPVADPNAGQTVPEAPAPEPTPTPAEPVSEVPQPQPEVPATDDQGGNAPVV